MSDGFQSELPASHVPEIAPDFPALPTWLARRLLRPGETVTWVRGPRARAWERYLTHPALFLLGLAVGGASLGVGRVVDGSWEELSAIWALPFGVSVIGSLVALGIASGYFTRLIVTDERLFIVQGYEIRRIWSLDALPRSLVRYGPRRGDVDVGRTIDLDALKTMLGGPSTGFAKARSIWSLGKQLDRFRREDDRGGPRR